MVPLISKAEVIGILDFQTEKMDAYSEHDLHLAERVASQIAGAIDNAKLFLERKQAEEALKESEAKYYDLYENAPDMYYSVDSETGIINECNKTFVRVTGYAKEEIIGRPIFELYHSDCIDDVKEGFQLFRRTGEFHNKERRIKCKDGRIMDVSLNVSAIKDKEGKIEVTTTTEKLAQRIGQMLHKAFDGEVEYKWSSDVKLARDIWKRDNPEKK